MAYKDAVQNEEVMIVLGDTVCDYNVRRYWSSKISQIGVRKVDDPRSFGVAELGDNDKVLKVVEKPLIPRVEHGDGGYILYKGNQSRLFEALSKHLRQPMDDEEGEYHLTNALQHMIEHGMEFNAFRVNNWFDCGKKETLLSTNAILLKQDE